MKGQSMQLIMVAIAIITLLVILGFYMKINGGFDTGLSGLP